MRKSLILSGTLALVATALPAQTVRWNDRPTATWQDAAPRVRLSIEGSRAVSYGAPVRIRFEVSENAYVTVVRVGDDGRMTILFPYSRSQRAAVRGGTVHYIRNPRVSVADAAFYATDRMSGYIFALASYAPLDFSSFENRDYNNLGGWSRFTVANRSIARRPDVFIDRFAAAVLWDPNTPYDYDVDYYHPFGYQGAFNTFAMCQAFGFGQIIGWHTYMAQFSSWDREAYFSSPWYLGSMCGDIYYRLRCYSSLSLYGYSACNERQYVFQPPSNPVGGLPTDSTGGPVDSTRAPNEGVVRGGLFTPTPLPVPGPEPQTAEQVAGRFDQARADGALDNITSIPARATRKMKEDDAQRTSGGAAPARTGFDGASTNKPEKGRTVAADAPERVQPPSREPTKTKATGEPRRETGSKGGYGSTRGTSEPRPMGPDRVSRPAEPKTSAPSPGSTVNPGTFSGTTTEKKKPPQNQ